MATKGKKETKGKKPFYKKTWFWIVIVLGFAAYGQSLGDGNSKSSNENEVKTEKVAKIGTPKNTKKKKSEPKESLPLDLTTENYKTEISKDSSPNVKYGSVNISDDETGSKVAVINFTVKTAMTEKMAVRGILVVMADSLKTTKEKFDYSKISTIDIFAKLPMTDAGGNTNDEIVATAKISGQKLNELNVKNFDSTKIPVFVDEYWQADSLPSIN